MTNPTNVFVLIRDLHRFLGYGSRTARLVLMGLEAGGSAADFANDASRQEFEDLHDYHHRLGYALASIRTSTWRLGSALALRLLANAPLSPAAVRRYRLESLGRSGGETLITDLRIFRRPSLGHPSFWDRLAPDEKAAAADAHIERLHRLKNHLQQTAPSFVVCYDKRGWHDYQLFIGVPEESWRDVEVGVPHHRLRLARLPWGGIAALTPFLGRRGLLSYQDVNALSEMMLGH